MANGISASDLSTPDDPRLSHLQAVAGKEETLGEVELHAPSAMTKFSFYPGTAAAARFTSESLVSLHERTGPRLLTKKWSGIISSFDVMFEGDTRDELGERMFPFLDACRSEAAELVWRMKRWGNRGGLTSCHYATSSTSWSEAATASRE